MRGTWGTVYPETNSMLLKLYPPFGASPRVLKLGDMVSPKLTKILPKSYPCGGATCIVAMGVQVIPELSQILLKLYLGGDDPYVWVQMGGKRYP